MTHDSPSLPLDELIARGLYDPDAPGADAHRLSLEYALSLGVTVEEIERADGNVAAVVARVLLRPGRERLTLDEVAARIGADPGWVAKISRATGLPVASLDEPIFDEDDVEIFSQLAAGLDVFDEDVVLQFVRVLGLAMARVADAFMSGFATTVGERSQTMTFDAIELARVNQSAVAMLPSAVRAMDVLLRRHMEIRSRSALAQGDEWEGIDALDRAVGFCDVVGYTSLSERVPTIELAGLLADFEGRAADIIHGSGGSVVKLIGDEVMFVAPDAKTASSIAVDLVDAFEPGDIAVRVGLAAGRVLLREGDYYGPVVNLAARLVKLAPPHGVLAPASAGADVGTGIVLDDAGAPTLKGFDEPIELVSLRRR